MNNREGCKGCGHYRPMYSNTKGCHYCYDTGLIRGCEVEDCDKYTRRRFRDQEEDKI